MLDFLKKFKVFGNKTKEETAPKAAQKEELETPLNTKRLDSLMNLDRAVKQSRIMTLCCFAFTLIFCSLVILFAFNYISKSRGQVFFTNGYGNTLVGYQIERNQNIVAEIKSQVRSFHSFLYNITPDPKEVKINIDRAKSLGDGSINAFIMQRGEEYYKKIIAQNIEIKYQLDSVKVNAQIYPYQAVVFGKEIIQNKVGFVRRSLITKCRLSEISRTDNNPHGLLISNFEILKNERLASK